MPILSIVTVTYKDPAGVRATLASVNKLRNADFSEIEIIVVEGAAEGECDYSDVDATAAIFLFGANKGIYEAMNRGIEAATGSYVWFLNGGDTCAVSDWPCLRKELLETNSREILLGNYELTMGRSCYVRESRGHMRLVHSLPTSHQAIFYPRDLLVDCGGYRSNFAVAGDYELTCRLFAKGAGFRKVPLLVARFVAGGTSSQKTRTLLRETWEVQRDVLELSRRQRTKSRMHHVMSRAAWRAMTLRGHYG